MSDGDVVVLDSSEVPKNDEVKKSRAREKTPAPNHPKYLNMIIEAIQSLKERNGSSRIAIAKYAKEQYNIGEKQRHFINKAYKAGIDSGRLKQIKGCFKVNHSDSPKAKKPKAANVEKKKTVKSSSKDKNEKPLKSQKNTKSQKVSKDLTTKPTGGKSSKAQATTTEKTTTPKRSRAKVSKMEKKSTPVQKTSPTPKRAKKAPVPAKHAEPKNAPTTRTRKARA